MLVGLVLRSKRSVWENLSPLWMFRSRNCTCVSEMLHMNLMLGCALLSSSSQLASSSCPYKIMSLIQHFLTRGRMGCWARKALSNLSMNGLAYERAIFFPMAVPWYMLLLKLKTLI